MTNLTKTAVRKRTAEIRSNAARVADIMDALNSHRNPGETLEHVLLHRATIQTGEALRDALNNIDGVTAQLREMLDTE